MTRTDTFCIILIAVLALTFGSLAMAQDGEHTHPATDAAVNAATAEIERLVAETKAMRGDINGQPAIDAAQDGALAERKAVDAAIGAEVINIKARLDALEAAGGTPTDPEPPVDPDPPVEPEPVTPWPVYLLDLNTGARAEFTALAQSAAAGRYTIQIGASATEKLDAAPFESVINGAPCGPERDPVYHLCGNNNAIDFRQGENSIVIKALGSGAIIALTLQIDESAPPTGPPDPEPQPGERAGIQYGPWYMAAYNIEEPFINYFHMSWTQWTGGGYSTEALIADGVIDRATGLPTRLPGGKTLTSDVYFTGKEVMAHWDGEWVLEADCTGDVELSVLYIPRELARRVSGCRIEFTRDFAGGRTADHHAIQITRLNGTLKNLRLYRAENEAALKAGKIVNPKFAEAAKGYDVLRTMDLQAASTTIIRSLADVAPPNAAQWGNQVWNTDNPREMLWQGMPLASPIQMAVEMDQAIWFHVPITLGAPSPLSSISGGARASLEDAGAYRRLAKTNAQAIIESPEWDRYADAVVSALIETGYPVDRPFYSTVANEVWNFAGQYFLTTQYAWGIGEGLNYNEHEPLRVGYGALMARWKLALDGALARAGREQNAVYVIEGQAYFAARTMFALTGAKAYLEAKGEAWADQAPDFGVSVASYWSASWEKFLSPEQWPAAIAADPDGTAKRFADFIINDPATFGLPSVIDVLRQNKAEAAKFGVAFIGAYEGGSHLERPSYIDKGWYSAFLWGEQGGRVNAEVNQAIAEAFPGFILSNYGIAGPTGGQPWFEGPLGCDNAYCESWGPFLRPLNQGAE